MVYVQKIWCDRCHDYIVPVTDPGLPPDMLFCPRHRGALAIGAAEDAEEDEEEEE